VRWGFLGAGTVAAHLLAPAVHAAAGAELYAVAARDARRAAALGPAGPAYSSYDELIADRDVDAVYIALPNDAHAPWAVAALENGKHVLCEKPMALNVVEVDAMAAAARRSGRGLVEALFYRWHPQMQRAEGLLRSGRIGTVRRVEAGFCFSGVADGNFRLRPEHGGGALYDVGCYPISAAVWAFGCTPSTVSASLRVGPTGVDLSAELVLRFADGEAVIHVAMDEPDRQWLTVAGDAGVLAFDARPFMAWFGTDSVLTVGADRVVVPATDPYRLMVEDVSAVFRGEPGFVVPLHESRAVASVVDAAFASARTGAPVAVR
jgi:xylose dehydrogenase (NAD/NADP)